MNSGEAVNLVTKLGEQFKNLRPSIEQMDYETLQHLYEEAKLITRVVWYIRCLIIGTAAEQSLKGESAIKQLSLDFGISQRQIYYDYSIYKEFMQNDKNFDPILPAKFYQEALKASDPQEAILYAIDQFTATPRYTASIFKRSLTGHLPKEKPPKGLYRLEAVQEEMPVEERTEFYLQPSTDLFQVEDNIYLEVK
jgi:hypothetical protein